jgi:uncharacterized protein (DUF697 family)
MVNLPDVNMNKLREIYDDLMGEADRTVTIAIVGPNKAGKAEVGAWFLLDRASMSPEGVTDLCICEYDAKKDSVAAAVAKASASDILLFVVDAAAGDRQTDMLAWQQIRELQKPYLIVANKLDLAGGDAAAVRRRIADRYGAPINRIAVVSALHGTNVLEEMLPRMTAAAKDFEIPLARRFPIFRKAVAHRIITATSAENAVIGTLIFLPAADMPVMTANQVKMILKIAIVYGQVIGLERLKELLVVFGSAIAMRAVARNLASLVPVLGWAVKGGIAYGGTVALGKAAIKYFENDAEIRLPGTRALKPGQGTIIDV